MVALQRGQLEGPQGAITCFEKGWDADEEHLNPMAYIALASIHRFNGNATEAQKWQESFEDAGGQPSVASEWILALNEALRALGGSEQMFPSRFDDSE